VVVEPVHWNGEQLPLLFYLLRRWRENRREGPLPSDGTAAAELIRVIDEIFAEPQENGALHCGVRFCIRTPVTGHSWSDPGYGIDAPTLPLCQHHDEGLRRSLGGTEQPTDEQVAREQAVLEAARRWYHAVEGSLPFGEARRDLIAACERAWPRLERPICAFDGCTAPASVFYANIRQQPLAVCPRHKDWLEANA
jgi:hypothetical protein